MSDPWKRETNSIGDRYPEQLELQLNKTTEATAEQIKEWEENELTPLANAQIPFVAIMACVQVFVFISMLMAFWLINKGVYG